MVLFKSAQEDRKVINIIFAFINFEQLSALSHKPHI
jgi:hypothetical protein